MSGKELELMGDGFDGRRVQALMFYPEKERARDQCTAHQVARDLAAGSGDEMVLMPRRMLADLVQAPTWTDLRKDVATRTKIGMVAGGQLAMLYLMDRFGVAEPSRRKAIHASMEYAKAAGHWGTGERMNASEADIKKAWRRFKSVSHFWAALILNREYPFAEKAAIFGTDVKIFIEVAKGLLDWAHTFVPYRADKPVLEPAETWLISASINRRKLNSPREPDKLLKFLSNYEAPKHSKYE